MQLHDLTPAAGSTHSRKRVGRGNSGKGGTYAGRGLNGQGSRSGGTKGAASRAARPRSRCASPSSRASRTPVASSTPR